MIINVTVLDYKKSVSIGLELDLDPNDTLAVHLMRKHGISEIITFDSDFDRVQGIKRIP
ncbi:MAG: type II toxin-antitoxin system VapC family toxin [Candidatus Asgardarchaeia archaeon]